MKRRKKKDGEKNCLLRKLIRREKKGLGRKTRKKKRSVDEIENEEKKRQQEIRSSYNGHKGMDVLGMYEWSPEGKHYYTIHFKDRYGNYSYDAVHPVNKRTIKKFLTSEQIQILLNRGGIEKNPGPLTNVLVSSRSLCPEFRRELVLNCDYSFKAYMSLFNFREDDMKEGPLVRKDVYSFDESIFTRSRYYDRIISFQFNPFSPSCSKKITRYEDDGRFIEGVYFDNETCFEFRYDRDSSYHRVHSDVWSQFFTLENFVGFDLISNFPMKVLGLDGPILPVRRAYLNLVESMSYQYSCQIQKDTMIYEEVTRDFWMEDGKVRCDLSVHPDYLLKNNKYFVVTRNTFRVFRVATQDSPYPLSCGEYRIGMIVDSLPHNNYCSLMNIGVFQTFSEMMQENISRSILKEESPHLVKKKNNVWVDDLYVSQENSEAIFLQKNVPMTFGWLSSKLV